MTVDSILLKSHWNVSAQAGLTRVGLGLLCIELGGTGSLRAESMDDKCASCMGKAVSMERLSWGVKPASAPASDALDSDALRL